MTHLMSSHSMCGLKLHRRHAIHHQPWTLLSCNRGMKPTQAYLARPSPSDSLRQPGRISQPAQPRAAHSQSESIIQQHDPPFALISHRNSIIGGQCADPPSQDLREMVSLQLNLMFQMLKKAGHGSQNMRATVYSRCPNGLAAGSLQLQRVAAFYQHNYGSVNAMHSVDMDDADDILNLHLGSGTTCGIGGGLGDDPLGQGLIVEDCLVQQQLIALPHSGTVVLPLADGAVLVGMLVVETRSPEAQMHQNASSTTSSGNAVGNSTSSSLSSSSTTENLSLVPFEPRRDEDVGSSLGSMDVEGRGSETSHMPCIVPSWAAEELDCFRLTAPLLAKACGMELRSQLHSEEASARAALARQLLRDAQRPLSTLNTFGAMLTPRLEDGDIDKDMAEGIMLQMLYALNITQGKVLQDLMWQLEAAIHPQAPLLQAQPPRNTFGTSSSGSTYSSSGSMDYDTPSAQQLPSQGSTWFLPPSLNESTARRDSSNWAGDSSSSSNSGNVFRTPGDRVPASAGSGSSSSAAAPTSWGLPAAAAGVFSPVGLSRQIPRLLDSTTPSFQSSASPSPISPPDLSTHPLPVTAASDSGISSINLNPASTSSEPSPGTIDLEILPSQRSNIEGSIELASMGLPESSTYHADTDTSATAATRSSEACDLVSSIVDILTAGQRLAAASGIHMVVNRPLVTAQAIPRSSTRTKKSPTGLANRATSSSDANPDKVHPHSSSSSSSSSQQAEQSQQRSPSQASSTHSPSPSPSQIPSTSLQAPQLQQAGTELMPRPSRSLFVAVSAAVLVRLLSYVLDLVLQCTPRGGALQVAARQDGQNVSVILLHSGSMVAGRWHTSSPGMLPRPQKASQITALTERPATLSQNVGGRGVNSPGQTSSGGSSAILVSPPAGRTPSSRRATLESGSSTSAAGSTILNVELAQELAAQVGGRLSVSFPRDLVNHVSGCLEAGSCVELSLPRAC